MVSSLDKITSPSLQRELAVTLNKIDSVDVFLSDEMDKEERAWYVNRSNELKFYRDRLIAALEERAEETDVRKE